MTNATQLQTQETQAPAAAPQQRNRRVFMPRADIYETADAIFLISDMPGVDEKSVDITLDKNVLTISGKVEPPPLPSGVRLVYEEYEIGDYTRAFTLTDNVDRDHIEASVKNGVLKVKLPKATQAKSRTITVKAE
jgi:HSP20 family protein